MQNINQNNVMEGKKKRTRMRQMQMKIYPGGLDHVFIKAALNKLLHSCLSHDHLFTHPLALSSLGLMI